MAVAIVPAAGRGARMGGKKLLLPFRGSTVIGACLEALRAGGVGRIIVVRGADPAVEGPARAHGAEIARNPAPERGMLGSIWEGLAALGGPARLAATGEALLVCPADLPALSGATVRAVREAVERGARLALPAHGGKRGHPLGISAGLAAEILSLDPAAGLRELRERHRGEVETIAVDDPGCVRDVDTPEEYRDLTGDGGALPPRGRTTR